MTTCSSVAALGLMPLLLYIFSQGFAGLENFVPYLSIIKALVFTLVPCAFGILINHYKPKYSPVVTKVRPVRCVSHEEDLAQTSLLHIGERESIKTCPSVP